MQITEQTMRWLWRGGAAAVILIGWTFIAWWNNFHFTPPVVFVCLGYFAAVATIYNLFRTGVAVVREDLDDDDGFADTTRAAGALAELEREKKTLLKAIKEAEFDLQMGKLSKKDADEMIRVYRLRAIEVIKELDVAVDGAKGQSASVREQIEREVRARIEVEGKAKAAKKKGGKDAAAKGAAKDAKSAAKADKKDAKAKAAAAKDASASAGKDAKAGKDAGGQDAKDAKSSKAKATTAVDPDDADEAADDADDADPGSPTAQKDDDVVEAKPAGKNGTATKDVEDDAADGDDADDAKDDVKAKDDTKSKAKAKTKDDDDDSADDTKAKADVKKTRLKEAAP